MKKYDMALSLGYGCKTAYYLKKCGLRTCANPLDWLGCVPNTIIHLYETKFKDFFDEYQDETDQAISPTGYRHVRDTKNDVLTMHHVREDIPLDEAIVEFKKIMIKRFNRLDNNLNKAHSILLVIYSQYPIEELSDFLKEFLNLYPNKYITLINVRHSEDIDTIKKYKVTENLEIIDHIFNDTSVNGNDPVTNPDFWLGNGDRWISILSEYSLN